MLRIARSFSLRGELQVCRFAGRKAHTSFGKLVADVADESGLRGDFAFGHLVDAIIETVDLPCHDLTGIDAGAHIHTNQSQHVVATNEGDLRDMVCSVLTEHDDELTGGVAHLHMTGCTEGSRGGRDALLAQRYQHGDLVGFFRISLDRACFTDVLATFLLLAPGFVLLGLDLLAKFAAQEAVDGALLRVHLFTGHLLQRVAIQEIDRDVRTRCFQTRKSRMDHFHVGLPAEEDLEDHFAGILADTVIARDFIQEHSEVFLGFREDLLGGFGRRIFRQFRRVEDFDLRFGCQVVADELLRRSGKAFLATRAVARAELLDVEAGDEDLRIEDRPGKGMPFLDGLETNDRNRILLADLLLHVEVDRRLVSARDGVLPEFATEDRAEVGRSASVHTRMEDAIFSLVVAALLAFALLDPVTTTPALGVLDVSGHRAQVHSVLLAVTNRLAGTLFLLFSHRNLLCAMRISYKVRTGRITRILYYIIHKI